AFVAERAVREKLAFQAGAGRVGRDDKISRKLNQYFEKTQTVRTDTLTDRLHRAGFYGRRAPSIFYAFKYSLVLAAFALTFLAAAIFLSLSLPMAFLAGLLGGAMFFILPGIYLEKRAEKNLRAYRRTFPDFM